MAYEMAPSAFETHRDALEHFELMMGTCRGRLAVAMDVLTDGIVLMGQHSIYCRSTRFPDHAMQDIRLATQALEQAKELVVSVMDELKRQKQAVNNPRPPACGPEHS